MVARTEHLARVHGLVTIYGTLYRSAQSLPRLAEKQGRGVALVADVAGEAWVFRHYRRGGAVMQLLGDRYLRSGNRALRELVVSEAARARGVFTPAVQAAVWYDHGVFRRFDIATSYIADARELADDIFDAAHSARAVQHTATLIRRMLSAGLVHRDFNLKNILLTRDRAWVLDLDRCSIVERVSKQQRAAMRSRFLRSIKRWEARTGKVVSASARRTLEAAFDG